MAGRRTFVAGEVLTASNINSFLMSQVVAIFANASARDVAIPSPIQGNLVYLQDLDEVQKWNGSAWVPLVQVTPSGFTDREVITATNSSWPVPSLASPIVKVTAIGGGGGGGGGVNTVSGDGGTTTFNAGGAGTVTAAGGFRGRTTLLSPDISDGGVAGRAGFVSGNGGLGGVRNITSGNVFNGNNGSGGEIRTAYLDLTGVSTVNVTIGAGGSGVSGPPAGGAGGRGEVIVEYVAA